MILDVGSRNNMNKSKNYKNAAISIFLSVWFCVISHEASNASLVIEKDLKELHNNIISELHGSSKIQCISSCSRKRECRYSGMIKSRNVELCIHFGAISEKMAFPQGWEKVIRYHKGKQS